MKKGIVVVALLLLFMSFDSFASKLIVLEKPTVDTLFPGFFNYKNTIQNITKEPVIITKLGNSCSCTDAKLSKDTIMPNEIVNLTYTVDLRLSKDIKHIEMYLYSDDTTKPELVIERNFFVFADLFFTPKGNLKYENITLGSEIVLEFTLRNRGFAPLKLMKPFLEDSTLGTVSWDYGDFYQLQINEQNKIYVTVKPNSKNFVTNLIFPTSSKVLKSYKFSIGVN